MLTCEYPVFICIIVMIIAVILIGISKAGFGGGVGIVTTPLLSLVFPAKMVIGFLLPVIIIADWFIIYHYRKEPDLKNLKILVPGALFGIIAGTVFVDYISDEQLKRIIGFVALVFLIVQFVRIRFGEKTKYDPEWWHGLLVGSLAGFISSIAHSAGVIIAMFLLPQNLPKRVYVATMAFFFAGANILKVVPYISFHLINAETLKIGAMFVIFVPVGVMIGTWLNRKISQKAFTKILYIFVFIIAVQLLLGENIFSLLFRM
ncbi:sulfite exporter TauE/SafE family protein [candidate division KSB1 bacterium]|nr:sulfite exporter TauE/SafE family protein [candidate division KSB1 bacterium]